MFFEAFFVTFRIPQHFKRLSLGKKIIRRYAMNDQENWWQISFWLIRKGKRNLIALFYLIRTNQNKADKSYLVVPLSNLTNRMIFALPQNLYWKIFDLGDVRFRDKWNSVSDHILVLESNVMVFLVRKRGSKFAQKYSAMSILKSSH